MDSQHIRNSRGLGISVPNTRAPSPMSATPSPTQASSSPDSPIPPATALSFRNSLITPIIMSTQQGQAQPAAVVTPLTLIIKPY